MKRKEPLIQDQGVPFEFIECPQCHTRTERKMLLPEVQRGGITYCGRCPSLRFRFPPGDQERKE